MSRHRNSVLEHVVRVGEETTSAPQTPQAPRRSLTLVGTTMMNAATRESETSYFPLPRHRMADATRATTMAHMRSVST